MIFRFFCFFALVACAVSLASAETGVQEKIENETKADEVENGIIVDDIDQTPSDQTQNSDNQETVDEDADILSREKRAGRRRNPGSKRKTQTRPSTSPQLRPNNPSNRTPSIINPSNRNPSKLNPNQKQQPAGRYNGYKSPVNGKRSQNQQPTLPSNSYPPYPSDQGDDSYDDGSSGSPGQDPSQSNPSEGQDNQSGDEETLDYETNYDETPEDGRDYDGTIEASDVLSEQDPSLSKTFKFMKEESLRIIFEGINNVLNDLSRLPKRYVRKNNAKRDANTKSCVTNAMESCKGFRDTNNLEAYEQCMVNYQNESC